MNHFTLDGYGGYRSRYEDLQGLYELLAEAPAVLGLPPAMPPVVMPYFDGSYPDDCGVSGFVLLDGGHITLHTFSVRECYFADVVADAPFDGTRFHDLLCQALPAARTDAGTAERDGSQGAGDPRPDRDFGPHWMMRIDGYAGPSTLDDLFARFDRLPEDVGMTPIMRPYVLRSRRRRGGSVTSALTMIAESHVAIHVFEDVRRAWFDVFSCRFFDMERMRGLLLDAFPGERHSLRLVVRGTRYRELWTRREDERERSRAWMRSRLLGPRTPRRADSVLSEGA